MLPSSRTGLEDAHAIAPTTAAMAARTGSSGVERALASAPGLVVASGPVARGWRDARDRVLVHELLLTVILEDHGIPIEAS